MTDMTCKPNILSDITDIYSEILSAILSGIASFPSSLVLESCVIMTSCVSILSISILSPKLVPSPQVSKIREKKK